VGNVSRVLSQVAPRSACLEVEHLWETEGPTFAGDRRVSCAVAHAWTRSRFAFPSVVSSCEVQVAAGRWLRALRPAEWAPACTHFRLDTGQVMATAFRCT